MNIELYIRQLLVALGYRAYLEQPEDKTGDYIVIDKVGESENEKLRSARFAFQSYSASRYNALLLNDKLEEDIKGIITDDRISKIEFVTSYPFNDMATKQYRYQAVFEIYYY